MGLRRGLKRKPLLALSPLRISPEASRIIPERIAAARRGDCVVLGLVISIARLVLAHEGCNP
jgi:hypothetical protein